MTKKSSNSKLSVVPKYPHWPVQPHRDLAILKHNTYIHNAYIHFGNSIVLSAKEIKWFNRDGRLGIELAQMWNALFTSNDADRYPTYYWLLSIRLYKWKVWKQNMECLSKILKEHRKYMSCNHYWWTCNIIHSNFPNFTLKHNINLQIYPDKHKRCVELFFNNILHNW